MKVPCADAAFDIIAMTIAKIDLRIDRPVLVAMAADRGRIIVLRDGDLVSSAQKVHALVPTSRFPDRPLSRRNVARRINTMADAFGPPIDARGLKSCLCTALVRDLRPHFSSRSRRWHGYLFRPLIALCMDKRR